MEEKTFDAMHSYCLDGIVADERTSDERKPTYEQVVDGLKGLLSWRDRVLCEMDTDTEQYDVRVSDILELLEARKKSEQDIRAEVLKEVWTMLWRYPMRLASTKSDLLYNIEKIGEGHGISVEKIMDETFKKEAVDICRCAMEIISALQSKVNYLTDAYDINKEEV